MLVLQSTNIRFEIDEFVYLKSRGNLISKCIVLNNISKAIYDRNRCVLSIHYIYLVGCVFVSDSCLLWPFLFSLEMSLHRLYYTGSDSFVLLLRNRENELTTTYPDGLPASYS